MGARMWMQELAWAWRNTCVQGCDLQSGLAAALGQLDRNAVIGDQSVPDRCRTCRDASARTWARTGGCAQCCCTEAVS